jgi:hypothetical protein
MLNWIVAMRRLLFMLLVFLGMSVSASRVAAQSSDSATVVITAPSPGTPLQGIVIIEGNTMMGEFISWEISFGYASDSTGTWFLISEGDEQVASGELTQWDTTTITDGDYNLRLTVYQQGGNRQHYIVEDLRVRNYSSIETITPTPTLTSTPYTETPRPSQTPTITTQPSETPIPNTSTPLPTNPATITQGEINNSLLRGIAGALAAFVLIGLYLSVKQMLRK